MPLDASRTDSGDAMTGGTVLLLIILGGALIYAARVMKRRRRRAALMAAPLDERRRAIIAQRIPLYRKIPLYLRSRLDGLINRFLDEITFVGRDGFDVTEETRVVIAAQACLLIMNRPDRWFPTLKSVIVYPAPFKSKAKKFDGFVERGETSVHSGESWKRGPVVLAWDRAAYGALVDDDGHNVVIHEFAHQLDEATGVSDGAPLLDKDQSAARWGRVFQASYERLRRNVQTGRPAVFDAYGASAPAEFFAVAVETFFEKPQAMKAEEPQVYEELTLYFGFDPARW